MAYTAINKSTSYFNTVTYTGNASTRSITGVGFQPDWCWFKSRGDTNGNMFYDAVRGATKVLVSNATNAEATESNGLSAFDSDGFSIGSAAGENANNQPIVAWNWKANGTGSANTDGTINSTVSVNQTAGFSIVKYTGNATSGATIGHGLGAVPKMIITKNRDEGGGNQDWCVYHVSVGANKGMFLNLQNSPDTNAKYFNDTTPTSSVFTVGNNLGTNGSGDNMIAYCFAEKSGYSKFGTYTGNGNTNGTFVYTGFKPKFVMYKRYSASGNDWIIVDSKRPGYNVNNKELYANLNSAEGTTDLLDTLSNGFKLRRTHASANADGSTYLYMAFGQSLVGSNNIPNNAR